MTIEAFEKEVMRGLLAGDDPLLATLREQYAVTTVKDREINDRGFVTRFEVPASAPARVVVAPGETLWSIAERVAPDRDPRPVVAGIQRLNDLSTPDVHAGQTLLLRTP